MTKIAFSVAFSVTFSIIMTKGNDKSNGLGDVQHKNVTIPATPQF